ncbi:hypothetical protein GCM10027442_47810 [Emticicia fontis]
MAQQATIKNLQELLNYAKQKSYVKDNNRIQTELARLTTKTAFGNVINPRIPTTASIIDNSKQPVSFIPAEIFGGPEGTFKEVTMGQRYISSLSLAPQFDILNPGNYARIQSARINEKVVEVNGRLAEKNLFDQLNACYHNLMGYHAQKQMFVENQQIADTILQIVQNKYNQGLLRQQEVNEAKINKINIEDKIEQIDYMIQQQYDLLKTLCDTDENIHLLFTENQEETDFTFLAADGKLTEQQLNYQQLFLEAELKAARWQQLPTLSFVSGFTWQNNSNNHFFDSSSKLINSNYWGLRINWDLPTNVNKLSAYKTARINSQLAEINRKHSILQSNSVNTQLELEHQKAVSQYRNQQRVLTLKSENFEKGRNQYQENILSLDKLLMAHNDLIVQEINLLNARNAIHFTRNKIEINNMF